MPEEPVLIKGDMEMIRRLYVNLIHNATKFTNAGGHVTVNLEKDDQFAKVSIKDDGIGLEKDDLSRIFQRFFQKSASYEGSGVGLTICEKIVSFHNGVIWAESEGLGRGTTMNTLFPYYQSENEKK
jgi:signal transduction histidine kinase